MLYFDFQCLNVFVERCPGAARLLSDTVGRVPLPVIWEKRETNRLKFSVHLDSVYTTEDGKKVYELSRVKGEERNLFRLVVILLYDNGTSEDFFMEPFQVKSKKKSGEQMKLNHVNDWLLSTLPLPSSKSTFSQPFKDNCISELVRIGSIIIFCLSKLWEARFFILCDLNISGEAATGEIWSWSLLAVKSVE